MVQLLYVCIYIYITHTYIYIYMWHPSLYILFSSHPGHLRSVVVSATRRSDTSIDRLVDWSGAFWTLVLQDLSSVLRSCAWQILQKADKIIWKTHWLRWETIHFSQPSPNFPKLTFAQHLHKSHCVFSHFFSIHDVPESKHLTMSVFPQISGHFHEERTSPSLLGQWPSLLGWRPLLLGWWPSLLGWRPSQIGWRPLLRWTLCVKEREESKHRLKKLGTTNRQILIHSCKFLL